MSDKKFEYSSKPTEKILDAFLEKLADEQEYGVPTVPPELELGGVSEMHLPGPATSEAESVAAEFDLLVHETFKELLAEYSKKDAEAARADLAREDKKRMITRARRADKAVSAALGAKIAARRYHAECLNHIDNIERCAYDLRGSGWWHQLVMNRQAGRVENQRGRQGPGAQPSSSTPPSSPLRPQRTPSSRETKPKRQAVRRATPPRLGGLFGASDESSMEQDD